jgi:hypothetical protein
MQITCENPLCGKQTEVRDDLYLSKSITHYYCSEKCWIDHTDMLNQERRDVFNKQVFCPKCGAQVDPCLMVCSDCGTYLT